MRIANDSISVEVQPTAGPEYVVLRLHGEGDCTLGEDQTECPTVIQTHAYAIPEGKTLLVDSISIFHDADPGVRANATFEQRAPLGRFYLGAFDRAGGLADATSGLSAETNLPVNSSCWVVIGFESVPEPWEQAATRAIAVDAFVYGHFVDDPGLGE